MIMGKTKFYLLVCCTLLMVGCGKDPVDSSNGTFKDSRDQHVYKYVKIGNQTWMAENLAYLPAVSPSVEGSEIAPVYYVYDYEGNSVAAAKETANYLAYGALYNWEAAKIACPSGWHLPSDAEWTTLEDYLGALPAKKMKSIAGWTENGNGDNSSGFNVLPGGDRGHYAAFGNIGSYAGFWSSSEGGSFAWYRYLTFDSDSVTRYNYYRHDGFSVRCLRN